MACDFVPRNVSNFTSISKAVCTDEPNDMFIVPFSRDFNELLAVGVGISII